MVYKLPNDNWDHGGLRSRTREEVIHCTHDVAIWYLLAGERYVVLTRLYVQYESFQPHQVHQDVLACRLNI